MSNIEIQKAVQSMANFTALLYYHLTTEMVKDFGEDAKATIGRAIEQFGLERGRNIAKKVKEAGLELTIENLDRFYDMPISAGWAPETNYGSNKTDKKYGCTKSCVFADLWIEKGWREIGRLYCEVDPAIRKGYNENIVYNPSRNILSGDDCCDSITEYKKQKVEDTVR